MKGSRFWASAIGVALLFALLTHLLLPYQWLGRDTDSLRAQAWLLTLWTGGLMSVLFGLAALLGYRLPPGIREVVDAGSVRAALQARRERQKEQGGNFATWLITTGASLIGIYFVAWLMVG